MTRTTPSRLIILQFGQIFLTDGRTFIYCFLSLNLTDAASGVVLLGQLDGDPVACPEPREVRTQAVGDVSQDPAPVLELHPKDAVREGLHDHPANRAGRHGHKRGLYLKGLDFGRGHRAHPVAAVPQAAFDPSAGPVRSWGPSRVMATVCS